MELLLFVTLIFVNYLEGRQGILVCDLGFGFWFLGFLWELVLVL